MSNEGLVSNGGLVQNVLNKRWNSDYKKSGERGKNSTNSSTQQDSFPSEWKGRVIFRERRSTVGFGGQ